MNGAEFNVVLGIYKELKKLNRHLEAKHNVSLLPIEMMPSVNGVILYNPQTAPATTVSAVPEPVPEPVGPTCAGCKTLIGNRGCMEWRGSWYHDECLP